MSWGVFEIVEGLVHVAPCDKDGYLLPPHRLADDCPCRIRLEPVGPLDVPVRAHYAPRHPGSKYPMQA